MLGLGVPELLLILLAVLLLFGYKKLPEASRSLGRSMRIFKGEMKGMKDDDVRTKAEAETVRGELRGDQFDPYRAPTATPMPGAAPVTPPTVTPPTVTPTPSHSDDPR